MQLTSVKLSFTEMRQQTAWTDLTRQNSLLLKKNPPHCFPEIEITHEKHPCIWKYSSEPWFIKHLAFDKRENLLALGKALKHFWLQGSFFLGASQPGVPWSPWAALPAGHPAALWNPILCSCVWAVGNDRQFFFLSFRIFTSPIFFAEWCFPCVESLKAGTSQACWSFIWSQLGGLGSAELWNHWEVLSKSVWAFL